MHSSLNLVVHRFFKQNQYQSTNHSTEAKCLGHRFWAPCVRCCRTGRLYSGCGACAPPRSSRRAHARMRRMRDAGKEMVTISENQPLGYNQPKKASNVWYHLTTNPKKRCPLPTKGEKGLPQKARTHTHTNCQLSQTTNA